MGQESRYRQPCRPGRTGRRFRRSLLPRPRRRVCPIRQSATCRAATGTAGHMEQNHCACPIRQCRQAKRKIPERIQNADRCVGCGQVQKNAARLDKICPRQRSADRNRHPRSIQLRHPCPARLQHQPNRAQRAGVDVQPFSRQRHPVRPYPTCAAFIRQNPQSRGALCFRGQRLFLRAVPLQRAGRHRLPLAPAPAD